MWFNQITINSMIQEWRVRILSVELDCGIFVFHYKKYRKSGGLIRSRKHMIILFRNWMAISRPSRTFDVAHSSIPGVSSLTQLIPNVTLLAINFGNVKISSSIVHCNMFRHFFSWQRCTCPLRCSTSFCSCSN